jgi:transposase-like protein
MDLLLSGVADSANISRTAPTCPMRGSAEVIRQSRAGTSTVAYVCQDCRHVACVTLGERQSAADERQWQRLCAVAMSKLAALTVVLTSRDFADFQKSLGEGATIIAAPRVGDGITLRLANSK